MDLKARVDINFAWVDVDFQTVIVSYFRYRCFFILTTLSTEVPLIIHIKFQPNLPSNSGEKVDFNGFAILSIGGHLEFSTRVTFTGLKPCSLIMLHMKFQIIDAVVSEKMSFKWTQKPGST